ncbi:MAG: RIP metalloprotease RseP [Lachnospiraceae bacterium]|nr:RIP metalloprotease RseP [Lachnospiraceae bacterium]
MGIILALLLFSFIVFFHELGHFLLARKNGVYVEEFCIGMGPTIVSKQGKETKYSIKLLPIGGACMMGEDDVENTDERSFNNKSVWARISVIAAGPIFNFILAFILSVIIVGWVGYDRAEIGSVVPNSAAQEAGLQKGDVITEMNGKNIHLFREISVYNQFHQGEKVTLEYKRDGKTYESTLTPKKNENGQYLIGVTQAKYKKANAFTALQYGLYEVEYWIETTLESLKMLFTGKIGMDQLSGPVGIVDVVGDTYEANKAYGVSSVIFSLINLSILLSANLGVMNLLPLPALDGGRLVFLFVEAIRGKRVPPEKEGMVHFAGLMLLFGLMIFVLFNDIQRLF